jgi:dolichol-phosphate mannosyltransferase
MSKVLVSPVAFNEHIKIKNVIEKFIKSPVFHEFDFLIVDDGSTDETTDIIRNFKEPNIRTIKHPLRQGVGAAIKTAIRHARQHGYEILVIMAGNDKDNFAEVPCLIEPILKEGYDFIQGSRYLGGQRTGGGMPFYRKVATRVHPILFSLLTGRKVTDSTNGFRAIRLSIFEDQRINIEQDWLNQYELEPYLFFQAIKLGFKVKEVPVTKIYPPKKLGYTKMAPISGWWSILKPLFYLGFGIKK